MIFLKIGRMSRVPGMRYLPKIGNAPRILPTNKLTAQQIIEEYNNKALPPPSISGPHTPRHKRVFNNGGRRRTRKSRATKRRSRKHRYHH